MIITVVWENVWVSESPGSFIVISYKPNIIRPDMPTFLLRTSHKHVKYLLRIDKIVFTTVSEI